MDSIFKTLKRKLSVDNLFKGKDDEPMNKEEDVRKTLAKIDPSDIVHVDEIAEKFNEITELSKTVVEEAKTSGQSSKPPDKVKSNYSVLQKTAEEEEPYKSDNVMAFLD